MKDLSTATGIGTSSDFLNGNLENNQTLLDTVVLQDIVQLFQKIMDKAHLTPNGNFDNETNDYQLLTALSEYKNTKASKRYSVAISGETTINDQTRTFYFPDNLSDNYIRAIGSVLFNIAGADESADVDGSINVWTGSSKVLYTSSNVTLTLYFDRLELYMPYITKYSINLEIIKLSLKDELPDEENIN